MQGPVVRVQGANVMLMTSAIILTIFTFICIGVGTVNDTFIQTFVVI